MKESLLGISQPQLFFAWQNGTKKTSINLNLGFQSKQGTVCEYRSLDLYN